MQFPCEIALESYGKDRLHQTFKNQMKNNLMLATLNFHLETHIGENIGTHMMFSCWLLLGEAVCCSSPSFCTHSI